MLIPIAHHLDTPACLASLQAQIAATPSLVVYFASPRHDAGALAAAFQKAWPSASIIGCSTAGEISSEMMTDGGIAAMAIPAEYVPELACEAIEDAADTAAVTAALNRIAQRLGKPLGEMDQAQYVGLVLIDGLSGAEEKLMEKIGDLTDFPFIGGSAGDDLAFRATYVALDGRIYAHGAVLAVLRVPNGYRALKTQSFKGTGRVLIATDVDEASRTVRAFDGQTAAVAYAGALGVAVDKLPSEFMRHPLGLMVEGEPYVRSPQRVTEGGELVFFCNILEGMELEVLESTDIVADTGAALEASGMEATAGILNFNCILRTLGLKAEKRCEDYARLFARVPTVGFSTYGEEFMGHINQTATMLLLNRLR